MQLARLEDGIYLEFATGEMIWVANDLSGPFVRALRNIFPLGGVSDINWFDRSDHHQGSSQHRYNPSQDTYALLFLPTPKSIRVSLFVSDIKVKDNKGFIRKGFTVGMEVPFQYNPDDNTIRLIFKDHYIEEMIQKDLDALAKKRKRRKPHISYRYSLHEFALEGANLYVTFQPNNSGL